MCVNKKLSKTVIFIGCMLIALTLNPSQSRQNRLYGEVQYLDENITQKIYVPLNNLKIEILKAKEKDDWGRKYRTPWWEVINSTHTDKDGFFTFTDIKEGLYYIRIIIPNMILMADLYMAEIRVQYINQKCSLPVINVELKQIRPAHELKLKAENTWQYAGNRRWDWRIYIKAPSKVIDYIDCVEYALHPTFRTRFYKICRDNNFDSKYPFSPGVFRGWGVFNVPIKIIFKDGKICYLDHMLVFK